MVKRFSIAAFLAAFTFFTTASAQDDTEPATEENTAGELTAAAPAVAPDLYARDTFRTRTIICPFKGQVEYKPSEISCGMLEVPENREKSDSRMIELHFVKISAKKPDDWDDQEKGEWVKRDDPIIYLTGGPGVKAQGYVDRLKDHGVREVRDLYILEQRGIGWSGDFCPIYNLIDPAPANSPEWDKYQRAGVDAMEACFAQAAARGVDLSGYSTIENARDVEVLRQALGFEQWNIWGISYGSILSQAYLKEDPEGIRAAVIDAIVPLQQDVTFHHIASYYDRDLDLLADACKAHARCAASFPDFKERFLNAIMTTSLAPIEVDAIDEELFPSGKAYFFQDLIGAAPFVLFYEQDNYPTLPAFIDSLVRLVETKNYAPFQLLTAGGEPVFDVSQGMYNAISCNDGWHPAMKQALEEDFAEHPALGMIFGDPALIDEMADICVRYGATPRDASDYLPVETDIRTLLVEGQMDPITPPPLAKTIEPGFSNATYVEFPYAGHGPTRSVECAGEFLTNFFDDPNGELDTSCPESMEAPDFAGPLFETNGLTKIATLAAEDQKNAALPALWIGLPAIVFFFGAIIYTLAPPARLINRSDVLSTSGARILAWATSLVGLASVGGLAYGVYASFEANEFLLLVGLLGWAKWFAVAGLLAGPLGLALLWMTFRARMREPLPIGVLLGLFMTGAAGVALASWLAFWGFLPF